MKPTLETKRLKLIPFELNDLEMLHETFTDSFVRRYLWDNEIIGIEQTREILTTNEELFESNHWGLWKIIVKENNTFAGFAGLWVFFGEDQPQLLYGLRPEMTGKGYATEASSSVIDYAFNRLEFNYLIAACDAPHYTSRKVCERLQMKLVEEREVNGKMTTFYRIDDHG
ncbi:hypothetical protein C900_05033 [Fulvivirga imtechensis AK7]|uniref:N-acetyltransferase domain-containing protein n=1 Tax=Fulvivirga imtechensis AK7 TaxID=1237149 RepID=L8JKP4_9BACT|nr:GNAT family N-acetyltransferase [Fulvivirga imtechensis]ELR69501.1 hypothetical protein C900_05033 [Fulvivirga imtechensis AK7]